MKIELTQLYTWKLLPFCFLFFSCSFEGRKANSNQTSPEEKATNQGFKSWAKSPPMGWNSYNSFGAAVTETDVKANADYMSEKLLPFGWKYIVVDYCWSYPHPPQSIQDDPPQFRLEKDGAYVPWLAMDNYGRLHPDPGKFPSSYGNMGFKPLGDYIHRLGLKFGIHVMRGIPRQAVWAKSPVKGINGIDASMIADTTSVCPWLNHMFGVNMKAPGAQEYYNSLADLYASWGVDYIKMDDMNQSGNKKYFADEAKAMHEAIMQCGRPMVLSLSPFMSYENRVHIKSVSNLWRVSKDFWDNWESLKHQFELADQWNNEREPGSWPDADMLQLGRISRRGPRPPERESNFTEDEQFTHMFLWCIIKSPLMMGGDMTMNTPFVEKLLTNAEILEADQNAVNPRQIFNENGKIAWCSNIPGSKEMFLALFNLNEQDKAVSIALKQLGLTVDCKIRDLWSGKNVGVFSEVFTDTINKHGAKIYKIVP